MRVLAAYFLLIALARALIWLSLAAPAYGLDPRAGSVIAAIALPLTPLLSFVLLLHLLRLLAGRTARAMPSEVLLAVTGVGGLVFSLLLERSTSSATPGSPALIALVSSVGSVAANCVLAAVALVWRRAATIHRGAVTVLAASLVLLALRSVINASVNAVSVMGGQPPSHGVAVTAVQLFILVVAGVLQLIAVLEEERASIVKRAEQLRSAEAAVVRSRGLEELGRMAGAVAHDFNNLLGVISMSAESARATAHGETEADLIEIQATSRRGQELTRQLLAFARQAPQQVARFDANVQLDKLRGLLQRIVGKHATLELSAAGPPLLVDMDGTQFDQVVMNLVVNARDATPAGGTITVHLADTAPDRDAVGASAGGRRANFVQLTVIDTGTGIPSEVLPHIFEPFFSTKAGVGTGLGLATCDGIIRQLGGRISVHSEVGKGTRFDVFIPRATAG